MDIFNSPILNDYMQRRLEIDMQINIIWSAWDIFSFQNFFWKYLSRLLTRMCIVVLWICQINKNLFFDVYFKGVIILGRTVCQDENMTFCKKIGFHTCHIFIPFYLRIELGRRMFEINKEQNNISLHIIYQMIQVSLPDNFYTRYTRIKFELAQFCS